MYRYNKTYVRKSEKGFFLSVLFSLALLAIICASSLAVDVSHRVATQSGLQRAADAAAMAGIEKLINNGTDSDAQTYAQNVAANNSVDGVAISNSAVNTTVSVQVSSNTNPKTVTVTATRAMANLYAGLFSNGTSTVSATAVAAASQGLNQINPNQLLTIAVSLDYVPNAGPQANKPALNNYTGVNAGQSFVIDLAQNANNGVGNPHNEANGCLLRSFMSPNTGTDTATITDIVNLGLSSAQNAGVAQWTTLMNTSMQVGQTINVVLITGVPPGTQQTQNLTVAGTCGFKITALDTRNKLITGTIQSPVTLTGKSGTPPSTGNTTSDTFVSNNAPWQCYLAQ